MGNIENIIRDISETIIEKQKNRSDQKKTLVRYNMRRSPSKEKR